jgi:hypothetical protein
MSDSTSFYRKHPNWYLLLVGFLLPGFLLFAMGYFAKVIGGIRAMDQVIHMLTIPLAFWMTAHMWLWSHRK